MSVLDPRLGRHGHRPPPALSLWNDTLSLALARVHELCGTARRTLALRVAAAAGAPVLWIAPARGAAPLNPSGMAEFLQPRDVLFVTPERPVDLLWAMEEALRSGAAPVVIADLADPPAITPVRRLHLAAEAGAATGLCRPLGLILTPGDGGAAGIETRWRMDPLHAPDRDRWRLERLRARMAPPRAWTIEDEAAQPETDAARMTA
ncbi:ImuA family protein [Citreimonas sp.]|uniref:ImuA family protein n=1 Tax=Citreimonas sp. TaxID=3036715 RepID=UPI004058F98A